MNRENQRIAISKRLLKEALLRLLRSTNIEKISVTELCREAGINRTTFYRYYEIPKDVLAATLEEILSDVCRILSGHELPQDKLQAVTEVFQYLEQNMQWLRIFFQNFSEVDYSAFAEALTRKLWENSDQQELQNCMTREEYQTLATLLAGGCHFVLHSWAMGTAKRSAEEMAQILCAVMDKTRQLAAFQ